MVTSERTVLSRRQVLLASAVGGLTACSSNKSPSSRPVTGTTGATAPSLPSSTPATGPTSGDWSQLRRSVEGSLSRPGSPDYDLVRLLENPRFDSQRPLAVLSVRSPQDVVTGLAFAKDHALPVAVRSGGHSYAGWSAGGSPPALVIDCRPMSEVSLSGTAVTIGSGAALAEVYDTIGRRGRALAAGSCATVGIAGLTLGGGVGVLTRAMGLTCDAVRSMQVVTADGSVRSVSADDEPDLFWALRGGGGGHLGVVTRFELQTSPAPTIHTVYLQWPISAASTVIAAWLGWAPTADDRMWSTLKALGGEKHDSGPVLLLSGTWTGDSSSLDQQLAGLLRNAPQPSTDFRRSLSYRDAMLSYAGCSSVPLDQCHTGPNGVLQREAFAATSHVAYDELSSGGIDDLLSHVEDAQSSTLLEAGISIDALGGRVRDLDPGDTAFVHRAALATVQYTATYSSGSPKHAETFVQGFRAAMSPHWGNHAYVNYADPAVTDYRSAYFGDNADRLARVRSTYDSDGFFTQPQDF